MDRKKVITRSNQMHGCTISLNTDQQSLHRESIGFVFFDLLKQQLTIVKPVIRSFRILGLTHLSFSAQGLSVVLFSLLFGGVSSAQTVQSCPCAGTTNSSVAGTSATQTTTADQNWTNPNLAAASGGGGATATFNGLASLTCVTMETITVTMAGAGIPSNVRLCSEADPVANINYNTTAGLTLSGVTEDVTVTGGTLNGGYTVTIDISFCFIGALNSVTVAVDGVSIAYVTQSGCVLPVELLSFKGEQDGRCSKLSWTTATEENNDYFTIQKRIGDNYVAIGTVQSQQGTTITASDYEFTDCEVSSINYYRLVQTDNNGDEEIIGDIISVPIDMADPGDIRIIPNPANDLACVYSDEYLSSLQVVSPEGKIVYGQTFPDKVTNFCIPVTELSSGVYMVRLVTAGGIYSRQLVKL